MKNITWHRPKKYKSTEQHECKWGYYQEDRPKQAFEAMSKANYSMYHQNSKAVQRNWLGVNKRLQGDPCQAWRNPSAF